MFLLWLRQSPWCVDWTRASVPPPAEGRSCPSNTPVFPFSSFTLLSFEWFYIFFSAGQVLLSALSWCSACTSVSEGVFLMYLWREMYCMSTYSSILFSCRLFLQGQARSTGSLCSKDPDLPDGLQGKVFKNRVREGVSECMISWCTILW